MAHCGKNAQLAGMRLGLLSLLTPWCGLQMPGGDVTLQAHASEETDTPTLHPSAARKVPPLAEPLPGLWDSGFRI